MSEMVERVARALDPECFEEYYLKLYGPKITADNQRAALGLAEVAIEAMREPTEGMYAVTDHICERTGDEVEIYQTFIDAALGKITPKEVSEE